MIAHGLGALEMIQRRSSTPEPPPRSPAVHEGMREMRSQGFQVLPPNTFGALVSIRPSIHNLKPDSVWITRWCNFSETTASYPTAVNLIHLCDFERL